MERNNELECLYGADGKPIKILGTALIDMKINELRVTVLFQVMTNLSHKIILGVDFLKETKAEINIDQGVISFYDSLVALSFIKPKGNDNQPVKLKQSIVIPPESEAMVLAKIKDFKGRNKDAIIEPLDDLYKKKIVMARCVVRPTRDTVMCRLLNPTNASVFLVKGTQIGTIESVEINNEKGANLNVLGTEETNKKQSARNKTADEILGELGIEIDRTNLKHEDYVTLSSFLVKNKDAFATSLADLPGTDLYLHKIETTTEQPVRQRAYRVSPETKAEIARQTEEMLKMGVIKESDSAWNSPILMVKKKSGEQRFCIDFRRVNDITVNQYFEIPTFDDAVDCMASKQPSIFSSLDLRSGYWNMKLDPMTSHKTAFSTHEAHYEFLRLPFGMKNAGFNFQQLMHTVLKKILYKYCLAYLDDVLIFSNTMKEHMEHLTEIFDRFREAKLKLNGKKCQFAKSEVLYLGFILSKDGIRTDESKIEAVRTFPRPTSAKAIKQWLGFSGYYRRFVKGYAEIASPLYALLKKDQKFEWNEECEESFIKLKKALTTAPVLKFPELNKEFTLTTDGSLKSIAFFLNQKDDKGFAHPISFGGRALRGPETRYTINEIEMLAIMEGVKFFSVFLANKRFVIETDHISLKYIRTLGDANGRLGKWGVYLMGYDFEIRHKPGTANVAADALSRREYPITDNETAEKAFEDMLLRLEETVQECEEDAQKTHPGGKKEKTIEVEFEIEKPRIENNIAELNENEPREVTEVSMELIDIGELQKTCDDFKPIIDYIERGELPSEKEKARKVVFERENCVLEDGILYHIHMTRSKTLSKLKPFAKQICVPVALRVEIFEAYHTNNNHIGFDRLYCTIREKYYWPKMYTDLITSAKSCIPCQESKKSTKAKPVPLRPIPPNALFERFHVDLLGPLKESKHGYKYVMVVMESLSRFPELFPLRSQRADELAENLYSGIIARYGMIRFLVSDLGRNMTSKTVNALCKICGIKQKFTSSYHPQADGLPESFNKNILLAFKLYCEKQENWPDYLAAIHMSYRSTSALKTTQLSPFECLHGRPMMTAFDLTVWPRGELPDDAETFLKGLLPRLKLTEQIAQENTLKCQEASKVQYDKKTKISEFKVGEKVWLRDMKRVVGESPKMKRPWVGPYLITQMGQKDWCILRHAVTDRVIKHSVHVNRLKKFEELNDEFFARSSKAKRRNEEIQRRREAESTRVQSGSVQTGETTEDTNAEEETRSNSSSNQRTIIQEHNTSQDVREQSKSTRENEKDTQNDAGNTGEWFTIDKLVKRKQTKNGVEFFVKWQDGTESWQPAKNITAFAKSEFYRLNNAKQQKRKRKNW